MNTKSPILARVLSLSFFLLLPRPGALYAQGSGFTYQGQLKAGTNLANGNYDFEFDLYSTNAGGAAIAGPITNLNTAVAGGLFAVTLNFGAGVFAGGTYWLDISVRTNGGGAFTELSPRQLVTPTPYAIYGESAGAASSLTGTLPVSQLSGHLLNGQLANSSVTIVAGAGLTGGGIVSLGGTTTLSNAGALTVTGNSDITVSNANGVVMLGDTATSADTPAAIVKRDISGNFSAGNVSLSAVLFGDGSQLTSAAGLQNVVTNDEPDVIFGELDLSNILVLPLVVQPTDTDTIDSGTNTLLYADGSGNLQIGLPAGTSDTNQAQAFGQAQPNATRPEDNTSVGAFAMNVQKTTGIWNSAFGWGALHANPSGAFNTGLGVQALYNISTGGSNTAVGVYAMSGNLSGTFHTAVGYQALHNLNGGTNNIALGYLAGDGLSGNDSSNIDIGNPGVSGDNNIIRLGASQTQTFVAGIVGVAAANGVPVVINPANGQLGTVVSSARFKEDIRGMDDVSDSLYSLRPVTFRYKATLDTSGVPQFGLVAEEVEKVDPRLVVRDGQGRPYSVRYDAINAMLLNEFLKEHRKVQNQKSEIEELKALNESMEKRLGALEQTVNQLAQSRQ